MLAPAAEADLRLIGRLSLAHLPVCIAKTQSSLSDDAKKLGRPRDFAVTIRDAKVAAGDVSPVRFPYPRRQATGVTAVFSTATGVVTVYYR